MDGLWTRVCVSVLSDGAMEGAIVDAMDIVLVLSFPDDAILVVLACDPDVELLE